MMSNKSLLFILVLLTPQLMFGQSPFNYGQNKEVYFISTEQRNRLGIKNIYSIDQRAENDLGGMWENWDVSDISFEQDLITDNWHPISFDSTYQFNFDSLINNLDFFNGTNYGFSGKKLTSYGGNGYGTFDRKDITRISDTVSIIATDCIGHCGLGYPTRYSKNVFNERQQLLYTVFYPMPDTEEEETGNEEYTTMEENDLTTTEDYENYFNSLMKKSGYSADTLYYQYDEKGCFMNDSKQNYGSIISPSFANDNPPSFIFHQCYINKTKMETFFLKRIGFAPVLVLIEIYRYGVFTFVLNNKDKKYYPAQTIILEQ